MTTARQLFKSACPRAFLLIENPKIRPEFQP